MDLVSLVDGRSCFPREDYPVINYKFDSTHLTLHILFHKVRRKTRANPTSLLNCCMDDVGWCKELHHTVLNFLSLKSRVTSVHRSQKPRTSDAMSTHRPCSSPLNLLGILDLLASHLRITNYRRTCKTPPISAVFLPSAFHLFLLLFFIFFFFLFIL